jgi:hypothetical protein
LYFCFLKPYSSCGEGGYVNMRTRCAFANRQVGRHVLGAVELNFVEERNWKGEGKGMG